VFPLSVTTGGLIPKTLAAASGADYAIELQNGHDKDSDRKELIGSDLKYTMVDPQDFSAKAAAGDDQAELRA